MGDAERLFCSKPFEWFDISDFKGEKGDVYLCCPAWLSVPVGNVRKQSVDQIWNGEPAQKIRRTILDGSFEHCRRDRCPFLETVSGPVSRRDEVSGEARRILDEQLVTLPYGPRAISCSYDQSCNLSCPTCRTHVIIEVDKKDQIKEIEERIRSEGLRDARLLYITGSGDPFGSAAFFRLLTRLDVSAAPQLREIYLQTNGQLWTPNVWEKIPETVRGFIKHAHISVDAARPDTYAINRRGGTFAKLLENLQFISSLRREGPLEWLMLSMVVQNNNFREMAEFVELAKEYKADSVQFHKLLNWGTFTEAEYMDRAVHLPGHRNYGELVTLLRNDVFDDRSVLLGALAPLRAAALSSDGRTSSQIAGGS